MILSHNIYMSHYYKYKKYKNKYSQLKKIIDITSQRQIASDSVDYEKYQSPNTYFINLPESMWFPSKVKKDIEKEKIYEITDYNLRTRSLIWIYNHYQPAIRSDYDVELDKTTPSNIPPGLGLYKILSVDTSEIMKQLDNVYQNLDKLMIETKVTSLGTKQLILTDEVDEIKAKKDPDAKKNPDAKSKLYGVTKNQLEFLKNRKLNDLHDNIVKYIQVVCQILNYDYDDFINVSGIQILQYFSNIGIRWHFDNITRNRENEIVTINISNNNIYYDMAPVFADAKINKPVRVEIPNGTLIVMGGDSRTKWTHGIPNNIPDYAGKYSILFKF